MNLKRAKIVVVAVIICCLTCGWLTSCASQTRTVVADNDMEIYVQANCMPLEFVTFEGKKKFKNDKSSDFPYFNTLILFPLYKTYIFQYSESFMGVIRPFYCNFWCGTYINRGDTIICIPDVNYPEPEKGSGASMTVINDTINYFRDEPPAKWFRRVEDAVVELRPYTGTLDLALKLDSLHDSIGYIWTKQDYDFHTLNNEYREKLFRHKPDKTALIYKEDSKNKSKDPHYPVYYRVPLKVKSKKVWGLANSALFSRYFKPVSQ